MIESSRSEATNRRLIKFISFKLGRRPSPDGPLHLRIFLRSQQFKFMMVDLNSPADVLEDPNGIDRFRQFVWVVLFEKGCMSHASCQFRFIWWEILVFHHNSRPVASYRGHWSTDRPAIDHHGGMACDVVSV